ncbi:MAG: hypothetical protein ABIH71_06215, partial [Candidatus Omnitrophota bacterium]
MQAIIDKQITKQNDNALFGYQFQHDLSLSTAQAQIWDKSRQIGFSFGLAIRGFGNSTRFSGFEVLYISVAQRLSIEWIDKIRTFCILEGIKPVVDNQTELRLPNGSRFVGLPQSPATLRSYSPDEIYIDEFAHFKKDREVLT